MRKLTEEECQRLGDIAAGRASMLSALAPAHTHFYKLDDGLIVTVRVSITTVADINAIVAKVCGDMEVE
jgi:hypothetical protein